MNISPVSANLPLKNNVQFKSNPKEDNSSSTPLLGLTTVVATAVAAYALIKSHNAKNEIKELSGKVKDIESKYNELKKLSDKAPVSKPESEEVLKKITEQKQTIENSKVFEFKIGNDTFKVEEGKIVECRNDKGEAYQFSATAEDFQNRVNAKLAEIKEGKYAENDIRILENKAPEAPKPAEPKPEPETHKTENGEPKAPEAESQEAKPEPEVPKKEKGESEAPKAESQEAKPESKQDEAKPEDNK